MNLETLDQTIQSPWEQDWQKRQQERDRRGEITRCAPNCRSILTNGGNGLAMLELVGAMGSRVRCSIPMSRPEDISQPKPGRMAKMSSLIQAAATGVDGIERKLVQRIVTLNLGSVEFFLGEFLEPMATFRTMSFSESWPKHMFVREAWSSCNGYLDKHYATERSMMIPYVEEHRVARRWHRDGVPSSDWGVEYRVYDLEELFNWEAPVEQKQEQKELTPAEAAEKEMIRKQRARQELEAFVELYKFVRFQRVSKKAAKVLPKIVTRSVAKVLGEGAN